jgi:hypothetical protein
MTTTVLGQFDTGRAMLLAARRVRELGFTDLDGHTPYALEGMEAAIGTGRSRVPFFVLVGGLAGASFGYLMMWWCNAVDYPLNVGGRPLNSYPAFVPITFELAVLFASIAAMVAMLASAGLPKPYHPVFDAEAFRSASVDKFWLSIRVDTLEDRGRALGALDRLGASHVTWVDEDAAS